MCRLNGWVVFAYQYVLESVCVDMGIFWNLCPWYSFIILPLFRGNEETFVVFGDISRGFFSSRPQTRLVLIECLLIRILQRL